MKENIKMLMSEPRLEHHGGLDELLENIKFIGSITPKLIILELCIRNKADFVLKQCDKDYMSIEKLNPYFEPTKDGKPNNFINKIEYLRNKKSKDHDQIVSEMTLGFWCKLIKAKKIQNKILFLKDFNFKNYSVSNSSESNSVYPHHKTSAVLDLLSNIRNRAFHCENLFKEKDSKPNITAMMEARQKKIIVGVMPESIDNFLLDLLNEFDKDLGEKFS